MAFAKTYWYLKSGGWSAVTAWAATTVYAASQWVRQVSPTTGQERTFVCIIAGTSASFEPSWTITRGAKTNDGTVTWQECTGVAGPCGDITNTPNWNLVKNTSVPLGQVIKDIAATTYFICTTSGTAGNGSEPIWNTTAGQTTNDGSVVWTSIGAISGYSTPYQYPYARIQTPASSGFMLAGETCYVSNSHAETQASSMTITNTNGTAAKPLMFVCANDSAAPPTASATTATVSTTGNSGLATAGVAYYYGIIFTAADGATQASFTLSNSSLGATIFESCSLRLGATGPGLFTMAQGTFGAKLLNSALVFGNTGSRIEAGASTFNQAGCTLQMVGGSVAATGSVPTTLLAGSGEVWVGTYTFRDVDMGNLAGSSTLVSISAFSSNPIVVVSDCKVGASVTPSSGSFNSPYLGYFAMFNCDSAATNLRYNFRDYGGTVTSSTSIYNNAGSTNGTTNFSNQVVTTANTTFATPFVTQAFDGQWNTTTGSPKTVTLELTCGTALTNADVWMEVECLGSASAPLGSLLSTRAAWFASPTTLTTSTATWTGALANVYKISGSITPQLAGPILVRLYVARPSTTLNYDVMVTVT